MKVITVKNVTEKQYNWLVQEAMNRGLSRSAIIKIWLQQQYSKDKKQIRTPK